VDALAKSGIYQPPWLWSVVEVVKACHGVGGMLGIGGIGYYPLPVEYCRNRCEDEPACSDAFTRAIINWNATRDVEVFSGLSCACKRGWMIGCGDKPLPLKARIGEQLTAVEKIIDNSRQRCHHKRYGIRQHLFEQFSIKFKRKFQHIRQK